MSHLLNQHRELHWKERENFVSHILRFSIYINISLNQPFFGLLTTRFHICHRSGQALVKSWVSACLTLFNQCCHHIKKWFSDSKIIGHMAFTFQMIGSRKNYIRNAQLPEFVTEMIGNAAGGETPGGQKRMYRCTIYCCKKWYLNYAITFKLYFNSKILFLLIWINIGLKLKSV